jgi:hypothetical protein
LWCAGFENHAFPIVCRRRPRAFPPDDSKAGLSQINHEAGLLPDKRHSAGQTDRLRFPKIELRQKGRRYELILDPIRYAICPSDRREPDNRL